MDINDFDVKCNGKDPYEIYTNKTCWVLDCNDKEFTLNHPSSLTETGTIMVTIACITFSMPIMVILCCRFFCKQTFKDVFACDC